VSVRPERDDETLVAALSRAARRAADDDADKDGAGPTPAAWRRLQRARHGASTGSARAVRARGGGWRAAIVAGALGITAIGALALHRARPLTYVVVGGQVEANGYVRGDGAAGTELAFSDGTRVSLARGTRMSVSPPGAHGARLRVDEGEAHFAVAHLPAADWAVEAGPYRVQVTGTVFDVRWAGADETATVQLRVGSVRVTGPHLAAPVTLEAGQRFVGHVATGDVRLEDDARIDDGAPPSPVAKAAAPPSTAPAIARAPAERPRADLAPTPVRGAPPRHAPAFRPSSWPARVARGEAAGVLAEARGRSLDVALGEVDGPALAALADAARYSGDRALSERVLGELRRRFPASAQAATAAFLLGRLADDRGDARAALALYRSYRREAPQGPYAAEALGREMLALERASGRAAARAVAHDYVERFPEGTYVLQARAILGLP
jgi:ferric-dicitrate binding protein FerR (iron transport regulator)/TolA-binding protein